MKRASCRSAAAGRFGVIAAADRPLSRRGSTRLLAACLAAAAALPVALIGGCETSAEKADKSYQEKVQKDQPKSDKPADRDAAIKALTADVAVAGDPASKVNAKLALAQMTVGLADELMGKVAVLDVQTARLTGEITALAGQIKNNNTILAVERAKEPKGQRTAIDTQIAAVKGADASAMWKEGIPSLAALTDQMAKAQEQVKKLTDEKAALETERTKAATDAEALTRQANGARGQASLDAATQSSAMRQKARDDGLKQELIDAQVARLNQDLRLITARQKVVDDTLKTLDAQKQNVETQWTDAQKQVEVYAEQSKKLFGDPSAVSTPTTAASDDAGAATTAPATPTGQGDALGATAVAGAPASRPALPAMSLENATKDNNIVSKSNRIVALVAQADANRQKALELYTAAAGQVRDVLPLASSVSTAVAGRIRDPKNQGVPQQVAWKMRADLFHPNQLNFALADILQRIARLHAGNAVAMTVRLNLANQQVPVLDPTGKETGTKLNAGVQPILEQAGLPTAAVTRLASADTIKTERDAADAAYKEVDDLYTAIESATGAGGQEAATKQAKFAHTLSLYTRAREYAALGDKSAADSTWSTVKSEIAAIQSAGDLPTTGGPPISPYLPADLAAEIGLVSIATAPPTSGPSTTPASSPTTVPTTGIFQPTPDAAPGTAPASPGGATPPGGVTPPDAGTPTPAPASPAAGAPPAAPAPGGEATPATPAPDAGTTTPPTTPPAAPM